MSSWVAELGEVLTRQGLEAVQFERSTISDQNKMWWGLNCCMLCEEYCFGIERANASRHDGERIQRYRTAIGGAAVAAQRGVAVCSVLVQAIGRKKL